MDFFKKWRKLPKKDLVKIVLIGLVIIIGIGTLVWAIVEGRIKPFAATESQITNIATVTYNDGTETKSATSNIVTTTIVTPLNATLSLQPANLTKLVDQTFDVQIILNSPDQETSSAVAVLNYNKEELEVQDGDANAAGIQVTMGSLYSDTINNSVDPVSGKISLNQNNAQAAATGFKGSGTFATIQFKGLKTAASSAVNFSQADSSVIALSNATNILETVTGGTYTLAASGATVNLKLQLQGRSQVLENRTKPNYTTSGGILTAFANPSSGNPYDYQTSSISTDVDGNGNLIISANELNIGSNYDFDLQIMGYLPKRLNNQVLNDQITLDFGLLLAGDFNLDRSVNILDFTKMKSKWFTGDTLTDLNLDGATNLLDFGYLRLNWFKTSS